MPVPHDRDDDAYFAPLGELRLRPETELYLGLIHLRRRRRRRARPDRRRAAPRRTSFGVATECGWGRGGAAAVAGLLELHRELERAASRRPAPRRRVRVARGLRAGPGRGLDERAVDEAGLAYDHVDAARLVPQPRPHRRASSRRSLRDGDMLLDYSGGTGILLDRLRLRVFDRRVGIVIVDASAKFLRVALEKYRDDPLVALRLLRFLKRREAAAALDEVLGPELSSAARRARVARTRSTSTPTSRETLGAWMQRAAPRRRVFINSGNIRNPRAEAGRVDPRRDGVGHQRPRRGARAHRPAVRAYREAARRRRAHGRRTPTTATACSCSRARSTPTCRRFESAASRWTDVAEETIEARRRRVVRVPLRLPRRRARLGRRHGADRRRAAQRDAVRDRLRLMRHAMDTLFGGRPTFKACWTYITCRKP